jgi:hypothetical protein
MGPIPRDISPELVLVDPDLAVLARRHLPDPGWLGRRQPVAPEPDVAPAVAPTEERRRHGWTTTLLLTVGALSLTLNGFWLAHALGPGTPAPVQAAQTSSLVSEPRLSVAPAARDARSSAAPVSQSTGAATTTSGELRPPQVARTRRTASRTVARSVQPQVRAASSLEWHPVADATYYNVVLWRDGKRILDLWPSAPRVALPTTPTKHEPQTRLSPGRYLWFVYPGFGAKPERRYGALARSGVFVVQPKGGNERSPSHSSDRGRCRGRVCLTSD